MASIFASILGGGSILKRSSLVSEPSPTKKITFRWNDVVDFSWGELMYILYFHPKIHALFRSTRRRSQPMWWTLLRLWGKLSSKLLAGAWELVAGLEAVSAGIEVKMAP